MAGPVTVGAGETLSIIGGGAVSVGGLDTAVTIETGGTLNVSDGSVMAGQLGVGVLIQRGGAANISAGSVTGGSEGIGLDVQGGTAGISGGSVAGGTGVQDFGGTVKITGGAVTGPFAAVGVQGGTVSILGGSVTGGGAVVNGTGGPLAQPGVEVEFGTLNISGCTALNNPQLNGFGGTVYMLTGTLSDGTGIDITALLFSPDAIVLENQCTPSSLSTLVRQFVTDPGVVQGLADKLNAIATAITQGNAHAKAGAIRAFINQVNAQTGKSISPAEGAILIQLVVKFQLTGASAGITKAVATLSYAQVSDQVTGTYQEAVSTSAATTGNLFRYDLTSGLSIFKLGTSGLTQGTYSLKIDLGDGALHTVNISLK